MSNRVYIRLTIAELEKAVQEYLDARYVAEHRPQVDSIKYLVNDDMLEAKCSVGSTEEQQ